LALRRNPVIRHKLARACHRRSPVTITSTDVEIYVTKFRLVSRGRRNPNFVYYGAASGAGRCGRARVVHYDDGGRPDRLRVDGCLRAGLRRTRQHEENINGNGGDLRDVGDVVEKFTGDPPGCGGNLPQRSVIIGVGPPSTSAVRAGRRAGAT